MHHRRRSKVKKESSEKKTGKINEMKLQIMKRHFVIHFLSFVQFLD